VPPQSVKVLAHLDPQVPAAQVAIAFGPAVQVLPQAPQFRTSESVGIQAPAHLPKPGSHRMSHWLEAQIAVPLAGLGHAVPHAPQSPALELVSTQAPLQGTVPPTQDALQVPAEHTSLAPQAVLQSPQWTGSVAVETHALPQRTKPESHTKSQPVDPQTGVPLAGALHAVAQSPQ
jgi:hypothetical protein